MAAFNSYPSPASLGGGYGFLIPAESVLPLTDPVFLGAPLEIRDQLELIAARAILDRKRQAILLGEGATGRKLAEIKPLTKLARDKNIDPTVPPRGRKPYSPMGRASSSNPPLAATGIRSRLYQLLRVVPVAGGFWVYWERDPNSGKYWGEVLGLHRRGHHFTTYWPHKDGKPRRPWVEPRDTIGLSPARISRIRNVVNTRWARMKPAVEKMQRLEIEGAGVTTRRTSTDWRSGKIPAVPAGAVGRRDTGLLTGLGQRITRLIGGLFGR